MFDYLAVLISVVLGLAVTHVLTGVSGAINRRHYVRVDWVQLFWAVNELAYVLAVWWGMYWWKHLAVWTVQEFAFLTTYAIVLFLMASALSQAMAAATPIRRHSSGTGHGSLDCCWPRTSIETQAKAPVRGLG